MDKVDGMTGIRHCESCGQVKFPSDHWQRKLAEQKEQFRVLEDEMLVLGDERNAAVLDAKENMEIANEFKHTMEEYRHREAEAYKALLVAAGMLSATHDYSVMHPDQVLEYILKETREMK
jgi:hypothetical protein